MKKIKIAFFDTKSFDENSFNEFNTQGHEITYFKENLTKETAHLAKGFDAVCNFVNGDGSKEVLDILAKEGIKLWLQRSMGYNVVDLDAAAAHGIAVYRVDNYSAETVAEHALTLMLSVNRRILEAGNKSRSANFSLEGLIGYCVHGSTVGVIGAGKIGQAFINTVKGMGANVIVHDDFLAKHNPDAAKKGGYKFVSLEELAKESTFVSLHAPLFESTKHIIGKDYFAKAKKGQIIINAARGPLVDTTALVAALKDGTLAGFGGDVLEREAGRFFVDRSADKAAIFKEDAEWKYLLEADNVTITAHMAFLSYLAVNTIAQKSLNNVELFLKGEDGTTKIYKKDGKVVNG